MTNDLETVEHLTEIIAKQADIITKLYSVVKQLNAVTSLDEEIAEVQKAAEEATQQAR